MIKLPSRLIAEAQSVKPTQNRFSTNSEPPPEQSFRLIAPVQGSPGAMSLWIIHNEDRDLEDSASPLTLLYRKSIDWPTP